MTEKHSQIEVSVFDHTGKVLDRGIVVLEPREQTGAPKHSLKFDPRRGSYVGSGITPGTYVRRHLGMPQISGKCRWTQPDCRPR